MMESSGEVVNKDVIDADFLRIGGGDCFRGPPCSCIKCSASEITACCGAAVPDVKEVQVLSMESSDPTVGTLPVAARRKGDCYRGPPCSCISCSASEITACCGAAVPQVEVAAIDMAVKVSMDGDCRR